MLYIAYTFARNGPSAYLPAPVPHDPPHVEVGTSAYVLVESRDASCHMSGECGLGTYPVSTIQGIVARQSGRSPQFQRLWDWGRGRDTSKVGASAYFIVEQPPHAWPVASLHHKCVHEFTGVPDPDPQKNSCKLWSSKIQRIRSRKSQSLAQKSTGKCIRTIGKIGRIPSRRTWFFRGSWPRPQSWNEVQRADTRPTAAQQKQTKAQPKNQPIHTN